MCCIGPVAAVGTGMQEQKREARVGEHPLKLEYLEQRAEQGRAGQSARRASAGTKTTSNSRLGDARRGETRRRDGTLSNEH